MSDFVRKCSGPCGKSKPLVDFAREQKEWNERNPGRREEINRKGHLKARFRLTPEAVAAMLQAQNGLCACCGEREATDIDHDHACCDSRRTCGDCVRAVLCTDCNNGPVRQVELGQAHFVDPALVDRVQAYLDRYAVRRAEELRRAA